MPQALDSVLQLDTIGWRPAPWIPVPPFRYSFLLFWRQEFTSCHVIYHDKFDFRKPNHGFDIALVQLSRSSDEVPCKVEDTDMVELKHNGRSKVGTVRTMGWGLNEKGQSAKILQQLDLDLMRPMTCARKFGFEFSLMSRILRRNKSICGHKDGADTCQGDSGGPLIIPGSDKECGQDDVLIGITAFGLPCDEGNLGSPGVFTRAFGFKKWIDQRGMGECKLKSNFNCRNPLPPDLIVSCGQKLENYFIFTKETVECNTVPAKPKGREK
ncbi:hypothetical protein BSKO_11167 [Bryopsis sp. KO-2023]|nr:hypothetical protein BSKO_11167 [Bryopsis sp. KO-2023]